MNSDPKVSIVVPFYNSEKYLGKCIESILNQTYTNIELICVDDGSTDNSHSICESFLCDSRVKILSQKNSGPGVARNTGFDACAGEYVLFMDSDDYLSPKMISNVLDSMIRSNSEIGICKSYELNNKTGSIVPLNGAVLSTYASKGSFNYSTLKDKVFQFAVGWNWDKIYSIDFLKREKLRFPDLKNSEDLMVVFPAIIAAKSICVVESRLVYHRVNNMQSVSNSRRKDPTAFIDSCLLLKEYLQSKNVYQGYVKRSYVNWVLGYTYWNMDTLDSSSQLKIIKKLKSGFLKKLDLLSEYGVDYYDINYHYQRLMGLERIPLIYYRIYLKLC